MYCRQGRSAPVGVYVYLIEIEFLNGQVRQFQGEVLLLR